MGTRELKTSRQKHGHEMDTNSNRGAVARRKGVKPFPTSFCPLERTIP